ncbi:MAG TPA: SMP-30/gluconolactonase/LRE family protein [Pricia sp.]|nr:SMP-30/gluconolactonase/LRE family protein [Pricia sp.]
MASPKTHKARLLLDTRCVLGEGPVWDARRQLLHWVDIEGKRLFWYDPHSGKQESAIFDEMIGAVAPTQTGRLLLALESDLASFDFETNAITWHRALQNNDPDLRCNDGKVGPNGHFWIGTMHKEEHSGAGALYKVSPDFRVSTEIPNTTISNGMAWSSDHSVFYYIDSPTHEVWRFDYDVATGGISNKKVALSVPEAYGTPDGMCSDTEGMLWIAHWGGNCVRRWNPDTGEVLEKVEVDAPHVTCCCFGGKDLDTLYITTARSGMTNAALEKFPNSGGLFECRPDVKGIPIHYFEDRR